MTTTLRWQKNNHPFQRRPLLLYTKNHKYLRMQKAIHTNQMLKQFGWRISLSSAAWILSSSFYIFLIWFHIRTISKVIIQLLLAEGIIPEIFWFEYANVSHHIQNILFNWQTLSNTIPYFTSIIPTSTISCFAINKSVSWSDVTCPSFFEMREKLSWCN